MGRPYDDCVFINCPFDSHYERIFRAIVFTVADCGFIPRCALEKDDSSETRMEKIFRIISECRYGVHDLSATELDPINNLPRFNMPLELGLFLGAKKYGSSKQKRKGCIILDRERDRYDKFCSDISGQDVGAHRGDPKEAIKRVRNWLRGERPEMRLPSGDRIFKRYELFQEDLPLLCDSLKLDSGDLHFNDLTAVIREWLDLNPW